MRQRPIRLGIAKAKPLGKLKGREPTAGAKAARILELHRVAASEIAHRLDEIGRASVYRVLIAK